MYMIRLLLDNGYSMMAVRSFLVEYDGEGRELAILQLVESGKNENLIYRADRYMETIGGIHEEQIAIIGFSAGGHLCASVSTLWHLLKEDAALYKPNAAILCYAVLTTRLNHCRDLLEDHVGRDEEKLKLAACDEQVSEYTPPTFLYGTSEDPLSNPENVIYYAEKLCKHGVPFECHIFPKGGHAAPRCDSAIWAKSARGRDYNYIRLSVEWMRELFGLYHVFRYGL